MQDYTAKLSDFGLAKAGPQGDETHVSTRVMGTYGYAAPEYVMTGMQLYVFYLILFHKLSTIDCLVKILYVLFAENLKDVDYMCFWTIVFHLFHRN